MSALTQFGLAVRKARLEAGTTMLAMAKEIGVAPSFLSSIETGSRKISAEMLGKIKDFFLTRKIAIQDLDQLADMSNKTVSMESIPAKQQQLVSCYARSKLTEEQLEKAIEFFNNLTREDSNG